MFRRPTLSTLTDTLVPYTTLFRSRQAIAGEVLHGEHSRQETRALVVVAEAVDHPGDHVVVRDVGRRGRTGGGELLEDRRGIEAGQAAAAGGRADVDAGQARSEEHTSELQSLMRISYAVFCLKKKKKQTQT